MEVVKVLKKALTNAITEESNASGLSCFRVLSFDAVFVSSKKGSVVKYNSWAVKH